MNGFRNNCRNLVRCDNCPVELLGRASDRVQAGFFVASVLHDAEGVDGLTKDELAAQSSIEVLDRTTKVAAEFTDDVTHLVGAVVGAVVLTTNEQCNIAHRID